MKLLLLLFIILLSLLLNYNIVLSTRSSDSDSNSNSEINYFINNLINNCTSNECFGTNWGIVIDKYNSGTGEFQNLYNLNEKQSFTPASCTKLFTTSTIFYTFGEDFKVFTPFFTDQPYYGNNEDLKYICIKGMGDPSISMDSIIESSQFFSKANSIGKIILDNSFYNGGNNGDIPPAWEWEDLISGYGALPTSLIINENIISINLIPSNSIGNIAITSFQYPGESNYLQIVNQIITTNQSVSNNIQYQFKLGDSKLYLSGTISSGTILEVPILNPQLYFLTVYEALLNENGIKLTNGIEIGNCNYTGLDYKPFEIESPELSTMLNYTLLNSDNLYAETFLRQLGVFNANSNEFQSTVSSGLNYIQSILGIDNNLYNQVDGSGLSRNNFITPQALITLIENLYTNGGDPNHDFISYLPLSGKTGTLKNRFKNTIANGKVYAKTGSMTGVNSLTGVVLSDGNLSNNNQDSIFFTIIANNSPNVDNNIIDLIDQIIIYLCSTL